MNREEENQKIEKVLTEKSREILAKLDQEIITTQDMLALYLISQTKRFKERELQWKEFFKN